MTYEQKAMIDKAPAVERGGIYEFIEADGTSTKMALVVAGAHRVRDRFVSILMLKPFVEDGVYGLHNDEVLITTPDDRYVAHCGMVTYVRRDRLGRQIHKVSKAVRHKVNEQLKIELGMVGAPGHFRDLTEMVTEPEPDYKAMYEQLLEFIRGGLRNG